MLKTIGNGAFQGCERATFDFLNADKLKSIGDGAFRDCVAKTEVKFPKMLETIGDHAFQGCNQATFDFSNADKLKSIGNGAFENCKAKTEIKFPAMLETIGYDAFREGIWKSKNATFDFSNATQLKSIGRNAFDGCVRATFDFSNADKLESIGEHAFYGCWEIKEVKFPAMLETIGNYAFLDCNQATFDFSNADKLKSISDGAFHGCRAIKKVKFPAMLETIGNEAFEGCERATFDFSNADKLTSIGNGAFENCKAKTEIKFPAMLETIGNKAFEGCVRATFDFSNATNLKSIGNQAFYGCWEIKEVKFPAMLETIGNYAFYGCCEIKEVKFPAMLETIGNYAFYGCCEMATFDFLNANKLTSIGNYAFGHCKAIEKVKFPAMLETIGNDAFEHCERATFDFSNATNLKSIGNFAFRGCTNIENIVIDSTNLVSVGTAIFENCINLRNVEFSNTGILKRLRKLKFSTDESFLEKITITGITIDMSPDIMSNKFKHNTPSNYPESTTITFSNENNTIDSIITLLNFENQNRDTFFSYFNKLIINRTQEAYHTDTINDGGFTKEFYQKIITSFFKTCNETVSPFKHCYDTKNSIYDVFWINNAFVDKYTNLDIEKMYFFFGVMYGVILNHGEYDMKFNIFNAALILCEYMLHDNELNKRQYRFQTIMSNLICLKSPEYDGCNYNFSVFDPTVVQHVENTRSLDNSAHKKAMGYTKDAAGNDTYISSLIDSSFNIYYEKIEHCILESNISGEENTPEKKKSLNTVQKYFIKQYLFDNLDNIDLTTLASNDSQESTTIFSSSAESSAAVTAESSTAIANYMKNESTKIIIRNIKLMKLFSQGVIQTMSDKTFQEFFDNIGDGNIYQYDKFIDNLKKFSQFPVIQNLIDYIHENKNNPTEIFKENILNFYEFYSNKRIYTPLKDVSKSQIAETVMESHSIKMTEMVMESHTCSNKIDIHNEDATAETVFTMLKNSKKFQKIV